MVDPYPAAPEPEPTRGSGVAPQPVKLAVTLIWVGIAVSLVSGLLSFLYLDETVDAALESSAAGAELDRGAVQAISIVTILLTLAISAGLNILFAIFIGKGANWARITYTVLAALGLLFALFGLAGQPVVLLLLSLVGIALTIATIVLLYRPESNRYFSKPKFAA